MAHTKGKRAYACGPTSRRAKPHKRVALRHVPLQWQVGSHERTHLSVRELRVLNTHGHGVQHCSGTLVFEHVCVKHVAEVRTPTDPHAQELEHTWRALRINML